MEEAKQKAPPVNSGTVINPGDPGYEEARAGLLKEAKAKERRLKQKK